MYDLIYTETHNDYLEIQELIKTAYPQATLEDASDSVHTNRFSVDFEIETDEVRFPICAINKLNDCKDFFSIYSIDYLNLLFNFGIYDEITLKFSRNKPLQIEYDDKTQQVLYLLAPRIENE
jgi:hypothetical protein